MQAAQPVNGLVPRPHMQMVGIAQLHLRPDLFQVLRGHAALDRGDGADIHKDRRLNGSVHSDKAPAAGRPVSSDQRISFFHSLSFPRPGRE